MPLPSTPETTTTTITNNIQQTETNKGPVDPSYQSPAHSGPPALTPSGQRENATFVTLARNQDVWEIAKSIRGVEDRFNRNYHYDWVFLNDKPFDDEFKKITTALVSGKTYYGIIPKAHWSYPDWIDTEKAAEVRKDMRERKIIYGDSESYRHMCRYESGFFFRHELMLNYEYYWRVEPSIELYCDISFDPFKYMREHKKKYSFVLSLYEYYETIPTLWDSVKKFTKNHPEHIADGNSMGFLSDDGGDTYNKCHFVSDDHLPLTYRFTQLIYPFFNTYSGPTSRLAVWSGYDPTHTWTTSTPSTKMVASSTKDGVTHRSTPLLLRCF